MRRLKLLFIMLILTAALVGSQRLGEYLYRNFIAKEAVMTEGELKEGYTVVLDAGHGGFDAGKVGVNQAKEKNLNLQIAQKLKIELENRGIDVVMTRTDENALADTKVKDMKKRVDIINASGADLAVSIHQNSYTEEDICGAQVFYYTHSKGGELAANTVQSALLQADENNTRKAKANDTYYMLKKTVMPVIIVECGFLSNYEEAEKLVTDEYQEKIAEAAAEGIIEYLKISKGMTKNTVYTILTKNRQKSYWSC